MQQPASQQAPWQALHRELSALAARLESRGDTVAAGELGAVVEQWSKEQQAWDARAQELLGVHHEINNALVGVRGNAQLLLMSPAGQQSGVRERLEVVLRESSRIQEAAARLRELKASLGGEAPHSRAA